MRTKTDTKSIIILIMLLLLCIAGLWIVNAKDTNETIPKPSEEYLYSQLKKSFPDSPYAFFEAGIITSEIHGELIYIVWLSDTSPHSGGIIGTFNRYGKIISKAHTKSVLDIYIESINDTHFLIKKVIEGGGTGLYIEGMNISNPLKLDKHLWNKDILYLDYGTAEIPVTITVRDLMYQTNGKKIILYAVRKYYSGKVENHKDAWVIKKELECYEYDNVNEIFKVCDSSDIKLLSR